MNRFKKNIIGAAAAVLLSLLPTGAAGQDVMSTVEYRHQAVERSSRYASGNACQKDFLLAMQLLKDTHPLFAEGIKAPFDIDSMTTEGYRQAAGMTDGTQLAFLLQRICTQLHDGHTLVSTILYNATHTYPVQLFRQGTEVYLRGGSEQLATMLGRRVERINGMPAADVLQAFRHDFSYENDTDYEQRLLNGVLRNVAYWQNKPFWRPDSALVLGFADGMVSTVRPAEGWTELMEARPRGRRMVPDTWRTNTADDFCSRIDSAESIGYLQLNTCFDPYTTLLIMNMRGMEVPEAVLQQMQGKPNLHEHLKEFFGQMKAQQIGTLVVDLRDNPGGCSLISYELLSWLRPLSQLRCVTEALRYSPFYETFYADEAKKQLQWLHEQNPEGVDMRRLYDADTGKRFSLAAPVAPGFSDYESAPEIFNVNERNVYKGRVVFIQNERTFSAAADIILMARDNGIGQIIGTRGCYLTRNYGGGLAWRLPNTGVSGLVSHRASFRPDRSKLAERELVPDVLIEDTWSDVLSRRDRCWEWIVSRARAH